MMIRVRRFRIFGKRMLLQILHRFRDGSLELRIVSLAHQLGVLPNLDVRRNTDTFHFPLAIQSSNGNARCRHHPPSINCGYPPMPTSPPHVRSPTSLPTFALRKNQGIASPPEPAN